MNALMSRPVSFSISARLVYMYVLAELWPLFIETVQCQLARCHKNYLRSNLYWYKLVL